MSSIIVQRTPADKPGESIVSSVLSTTDALLERGSYEINNAVDRILFDGSVVGLTYIDPMEMVKVDNVGDVRNGLVTRVSGSITFRSEINVRTQITVEAIK